MPVFASFPGCRSRVPARVHARYLAKDIAAFMEGAVRVRTVCHPVPLRETMEVAVSAVGAVEA